MGLDEALPTALAFLAQMKKTAFEQFAAHGLSPAQAHTLRTLETLHSQRELADFLGCDASNVTGIVDRLEALGLAERRVDPEDRRVRQVVLTDAGRVLRDDLYDGISRGSPLARLSAAELMQFVELLHKMVDPEHVEAARHFLGG
jgi:DNA-binding MarR family transcriptional regulator